MPIKFLEDIAIADVAFEARAKTLEDLFNQVGQAFYQISAAAAVPPERHDKLAVKGANLEDLLFNFVDELIFLRDTTQMLYSDFDCQIKKREVGYELTVSAGGAALSEKHQLKIDIKALTYHQFAIKQLPNGQWYCRLVLDV